MRKHKPQSVIRENYTDSFRIDWARQSAESRNCSGSEYRDRRGPMADGMHTGHDGVVGLAPMRVLYEYHLPRIPLKRPLAGVVIH